MSTREASLGGSAEAISSGLASDGRDGWSDLAPHPFRRWVARAFDSYVTTGLEFAAFAAPWAVFGAGEARFLPLGFLAVVYFVPPLHGVVTALLNAALLTSLSTTPGKWLCGVRIVRKDGAPLSFGLAFRRELAALALGCGFYLPLVGLLALGWSFSRLSKVGATGWDEARGLVALQRPNSVRQFGFGLLALVPVVAVVLAIVTLGVILKFAQHATPA